MFQSCSGCPVLSAVAEDFGPWMMIVWPGKCTYCWWICTTFQCELQQREVWRHIPDVFDNSDLVFYLVSACLPICSVILLYASLILNFTCFQSGEYCRSQSSAVDCFGLCKQCVGQSSALWAKFQVCLLHWRR